MRQSNLSRRKHRTAITFSMSIGNAPVCQSSAVISSCVYFNTAFVRGFEFKSRIQKPRWCFANGRKTARSARRIYRSLATVTHSAAQYEVTLMTNVGGWVCEWRGKMGVSFPAGIFHRFYQHESVSRVALPWKRYSTFLPRGWLARPKFCGLFCFDKRMTNVTVREMQTIQTLIL